MTTKNVKTVLFLQAAKILSPGILSNCGEALFGTQFVDNNPLPVTTHFSIDSWFERQGRKVDRLVSGEKVTMKVSVTVAAHAEYVQLEIPIPAGCTYAQKKQEGYRMHTEFLKDKVVLFVENMTKGKHEFEIELEPRYTGAYHINPVKAELMYFPVFYGRNGQERIIIQ